MAAESARDRILDAAEARLLKLGPTGLVLEAVATDAGVSKGGLLYHFPCKEALVEVLTERMLDGFDELLAELEGAEPFGARARAYLASTVRPSGEPADNSGQLMAGILAALGRESSELERVRTRFSAWHQALAGDGLDETTAAIVRLAADGLWLSSLLGLPQAGPRTRARVVSALREMTRAAP